MVRRTLGFSLLELMVVIAIIGITLSIAIPSYSSYSAKSKIQEAINLLNSTRTQVSEAYGSSNAYPSAILLGTTSIPRVSGSVTSYSGGSGVVTGVTYWAGASTCSAFLLDFVLASSLGGGNVMLMGKTDATTGVVSFYCGIWDSANTRANSLKYLPSTCNATNLSVIACS